MEISNQTPQTCAAGSVGMAIANYTMGADFLNGFNGDPQADLCRAIQ